MSRRGKRIVTSRPVVMMIGEGNLLQCHRKSVQGTSDSAICVVCTPRHAGRATFDQTQERARAVRESISPFDCARGKLSVAQRAGGFRMTNRILPRDKSESPRQIGILPRQIENPHTDDTSTSPPSRKRREKGGAPAAVVGTRGRDCGPISPGRLDGRMRPSLREQSILPE
jgi:hypothetical protein